LLSPFPGKSAGDAATQHRIASLRFARNEDEASEICYGREMDDAQRQLGSFIDKFTPHVAALTRALLAKMKVRIPGAQILVYDNYNALAIGFCRNDKAGQAILSLAVMPKWVTLCFLWGKSLSDPHKLLKGEGSRVRNLRLHTPDALDDPRIEALIAEALATTEWPIDPQEPQRLIVKSISAKQRPRRPTERIAK
jgi:hypothetical protein